MVGYNILCSCVSDTNAMISCVNSFAKQFLYSFHNYVLFWVSVHEASQSVYSISHVFVFLFSVYIAFLLYKLLGKFLLSQIIFPLYVWCCAIFSVQQLLVFSTYNSPWQVMVHNQYSSLSSVADNQESSSVYEKTNFLNRLCKHPVQWRWFKQRGVALILYWIFVCFVITRFISQILFKKENFKPQFVVIMLIFATFIPIAGWLADVYVGRYRVIKTSMILMLFGASCFSLVEALNTKVDFLPKYVYSVVFFISISSMCLGLSGFLANLFQFGMDQLCDSSTFDITSYLILCLWAYFSSNVVITFAFNCICKHYMEYANLLLPVILSFAVSLDFLFGHWLVKEPVAHNPLKLIFKVLQYAVKNKYPRLRSAYTYWDERQNSRLDLAKIKYGGPFTAEQVEDVKKFFQILSVIVLCCLLMGLLANSDIVYHTSILSSFNGMKPTDDETCIITTQCHRVLITDIGGSLVLVLMIPVWEVFFFPMLWRCLQKWTIFCKLILGVIFMLLFLASALTIEVVRDLQMNANQTMSCTTSSSIANIDLSYGWLAIPNFFLNLGVFFLGIAGLKFVFSQSPYSMQGLVLNMLCIILGVSFVLFYGFQLLFHLPFFYGLGSLNCVFWFMLASSIIALVFLILSLVACYCYQNRQRYDETDVA